MQILEERYDINREFERITTLFTSGLITFDVSYLSTVRTKVYTLEEMISEIFYQWKGRGTCINYKDLRKELGIDEIVNKKNRTVDEVLSCLEYYVNVEKLFMNKIAGTLYQKGYNLNIENYTILQTNLSKLLDFFHQQVQLMEDGIFWIIPKDPAATAVAEISSKDTAFAILKYHHASLKGQLEEKRKLLQAIANEHEDLLKNPVDGFTEYFKTARNAVNNLNIRHNNVKGKNQKDIVVEMKNEELENWYDETYQLLLFCVLIKDNKDRKDKLDELLKNVNSKSDKKVQRKE